MSAHSTLQDIFIGSPLKDPGASGTITVDRSPCYVPLISATAETRTLARPTREGAVLFLSMRTDGGDITLTVTGGFNEDGDTSFTFSDAGQFAAFVSGYDGTNYYWRLFSHYEMGNIAPTEFAGLDAGDAVLATLAGTGITAAAETYKTSVYKFGSIIYTTILLDLTGLDAIATDGDIIGKSTNPAHLGQITAARNGTIAGGRVCCLELPAGASTDIDLFTANLATGKLDDAISGLTGQAALVTAGGAWTNGAVKGLTAVPPANDYLYLTNGAGANAGTYTAGKFLIELFGY